MDIISDNMNKNTKTCNICGLKITYNDRWGWRHIMADGYHVRAYNDFPYRHTAIQGLEEPTKLSKIHHRRKK